MYVRILRNIERPQAKDLAGVAVFMLQFDVELCRIGSNPGGCSNSYTGYYTPQAHLSASWTRQAGKVQRYIHL